MDSLYDLVRCRRSIRHFQERPIEEEKVKRVLAAALMSPASKRSNGWEFWVVNDKERLEKLSMCREHGSKLLAKAPLAVVVTMDEEKSDVWVEDGSIAAIIIQLAAEDLGLGSCWVQVHGRKREDGITAEQYVRKIVGIPDNLRVLNIVAIGYKDELKEPHREEDISFDKIHWVK